MCLIGIGKLRRWGRRRYGRRRRGQRWGGRRRGGRTGKRPFNVFILILYLFLTGGCAEGNGEGKIQRKARDGRRRGGQRGGGRRRGGRSSKRPFNAFRYTNLYLLLIGGCAESDGEGRTQRKARSGWCRHSARFRRQGCLELWKTFNPKYSVSKLDRRERPMAKE